MTNFGFLANTKEYTMFSVAAMEAEKVYAPIPMLYNIVLNVCTT